MDLKNRCFIPVEEDETQREREREREREELFCGLCEGEDVRV
jgi:hypothetical protein